MIIHGMGHGSVFMNGTTGYVRWLWQGKLWNKSTAVACLCSLPLIEQLCFKATDYAVIFEFFYVISE